MVLFRNCRRFAYQCGFRVSGFDVQLFRELERSFRVGRVQKLLVNR